jgi:DNA repair protein SbcC/Rad50
MKLKSITLENIRSYKNITLDFPEGSLLLSGNIGCGKSSILLGIDFALFGIQRGNLDGSALLRHSEETGSVELLLEIQDKLVKIKRNLKRTAKAITQDSGEITINNETKKLTPLELKNEILKLLNYPQDLLTKNKSLIYRYTVYTPQEQMKQILLGSKEERLETLRKVFGIDKYKRIKDNSKILTTHIKQKKKFYQGETQDIPEKQKLHNEKHSELHLIKQELQQITPSYNLKKQELENKIKEIETFEQSIKELNEHKNSLKLLETNLSHLTQKQQLNQKNMQDLQLKVQELKSQDLEIKGSYTDLIKQQKEQITILEKQIQELRDKKQEYKVKTEHSKTIQNKITTIDSCPTCQQQVTEAHKVRIQTEHNTNIQTLEQQLILLENQEERLKENLSLLKTSLETLNKKHSQLELIQLKLKSLREKEESLIIHKTQQENTQNEINKTTDLKQVILKQIQQLQSSEEQFLKIKPEKELLERQVKHLELEKTSLEAKSEPLQKIIETLEQEIARKLAVTKKLNNLNELLTFFDTTFVPLLDNMERNILYKVHEEFNDIFTRWLSILIDFSVELDEDFTPKIQQDGYDVDYQNLSGGEKTSIALAYRLALNQVINRLMVHINTKGLLILDEPTDGFSSEQLDKVNDLLQQLEMQQIVLVSHENKIESFVDNIIRFEKQDNITQII